MRYNREAMNQVHKDMRVEFGLEWGLTEPVTDENATYSEYHEYHPQKDRTRELARKMKAENWRDKE